MIDIPKLLVRQIISGSVIPFIGAGFSRYYGYPSWSELLDQVSEKLDANDLSYEDISTSDPLQLAQSLLHLYKEQNYLNCKENLIKELELDGALNDKNELNELLNEILEAEIQKRLEKEFSEIVLNEVKISEERQEHEAIKKLEKLSNLNISNVLTTNYDHVLENLFINHKILSPGTGKELNWNENEKSIIKIHGDIESPEGTIFTHSQFYRFMHEFGYFRSKLYTLFSSNIILMMGYGFNDLTIHQTYFQFIRDYREQLPTNKFYMVLTEFDKTKWNSYYDYYVRFLESYNITVIETKDLPTFAENLVESVEIERSSNSLSTLFEYHSSNSEQYSKALTSAIDNGSNGYIPNDLRTNKDVLEALIKIFRGPYMLNEAPFNKSIEGSTLDSQIGVNILDYTIKLVNDYPEIGETDEFNSLSKLSLEFASQTGDFFGVELRLSRFLDLVDLNYEKYLTYDEVVGKAMFEIFDFCHPTKYLKSNPGGKFIQNNLRKFPAYYIYNYLKKNEKEYPFIDQINQFWIKQIKSEFEENYELHEMATKLLKKLEADV
ncbi:hypothetical protein GCM10011351_28240 [Paraliobacillus quinghaiensis]|uniref:SIR2-like domain-containing protein n=1 Tax=Paraliobacillus quinghaiensis TaxID=470815 RepID=A0A917TXK8_9BACI|nr:SIR2 family protein [Paraliobacillus quinghaiensis]GGM40438.1 hypothetical protein GCM10011351_28240 [Paraliobacillus quinghaiensis]